MACAWALTGGGEQGFAKVMMNRDNLVLEQDFDGGVPLLRKPNLAQSSAHKSRCLSIQLMAALVLAFARLRFVGLHTMTTLA